MKKSHYILGLIIILAIGITSFLYFSNNVKEMLPAKNYDKIEAENIKLT